MAEKRSTESKTKYNSSLRKTTSMGPKITKTNFSVSMVSTRSNTENKTKDGAKEKQTEPAIEVDLETPDQGVDEVEKKTTPMPNPEEPNPKSMEFSSIDTVEYTTGNTPETVKDDSQAKRTSFTERLATMIGMKSRDAVAEELKAERGKTFGMVLTKTTDADQSEDQVRPSAVDKNRATVERETTSFELGDLMAKLDQIDKKLKHSEEDREVIKKNQDTTNTSTWTTISTWPGHLRKRFSRCQTR